MKSLGIDVGGTFTDLILIDDDLHEIKRAKVSTTPDAPEKGVLEGLQALEISPEELSFLVHGTTLVTNLVIERKGAKVGLLTTKGHEDLLDIQLSYRSEPYNLQWEKTPPLVPGPRRIGINERLRADGSVLRPLNEEEVVQSVYQLVAQGVETIAICFLHSYRNDEHERQAREIVRRVAPNVRVCISSEADPQIREYQRVSTTVLNAYAMPRAHDYITNLADRVRPRDGILYMHSGGGVLPAELAAEFPIYLILSGPAGGVLGATFAAGLAGHRNLIGMDMGGTSCDVSVVTDGEYGRKEVVWVEWMIGARVQAIDVNSIGAGGGSIAWIDTGGHLRIGPSSAGAEPGPACYGRGGDEPTVTDANMVLGILNPEYFLGGEFTVYPTKAADVVERLGRRIDASTEDTAKGIFALVNANMAQAIREITVERGIDPRDYTLIAFGGAGGQHAASVAQELGIQRVLYPNYASVLSAFGVATADIQYPISRSYMGVLDESDEAFIAETYKALEERALEALHSSSEAREGEVLEVRRVADMRYLGQMYELRVPIEEANGSVESMSAAFNAAHQAQYRTVLDDPVELVNLHVVATRRLPKPAMPIIGSGSPSDAYIGTRETLLENHPVPVFRRDKLTGSADFSAPAIIEDVDSTIFVPGSWQISVEKHGHIIIERSSDVT